jgi:hypothetical protein
MATDEEMFVTSMELVVSRLHLVAEGIISTHIIVPMVKGHGYIDRAKGNLGGNTTSRRTWTRPCAG